MNSHGDNSVLVQIRNARKSFRNDAILEGISLTIRRGEVVGLWGRNASGKSTILRLAAGMLEADNKDAVVWPNAQLQIGYLAQDPLTGLLPWFKAWKNVVIHSRGRCSRKEAEAVLEGFGFDGTLATPDSYPLELSGGSVQRLAWACATLPQTALLFLDEPFAEQDQRWCRHLWLRIRTLANSGVGVLLIAHEPHLLSLCCDRIIAIKGRPVSVDMTREMIVPLERRESWQQALSDLDDFVRDLQSWLYEESPDEIKAQGTR